MVNNMEGTEGQVELIIIGAGPAGTAAGVYAARKKLKTILVTKEFGGQSVVSPGIENWVGTTVISGADLATSFKEHLRANESDTFSVREVGVDKVEERDGVFFVTLTNGDVISAQSILFAAGSDRRRLQAENADIFEHKGLTYCASCDGPLFSGKDVAVVGGGNAGFETAAQLLAYAKSVTLLQRSGAYRADPITVEKVLSNEHMKGILNVAIKRIEGETLVSGVVYVDNETQEEHTLPVEGVFVEIGLVPTTEILGDLVTLDAHKRIEVDPQTQQTSHTRIWAAGDCTNVRFHQNNIAAGDAVKAIEHLYLTLRAGV